jgi:hypothetical protein
MNSKVTIRSLFKNLMSFIELATSLVQCWSANRNV